MSGMSEMRGNAKKDSRRTAELLAPAGGEAALIAAVENGADAVYCGGRLFNARQGAGNFSDEAMREAIGFAHEHGVKIHVTMNTLLRDDELRDAFRYAEFLYTAGADALIVQDLGLAGLCHRYLPDLPLHFSTQGTAVDADCVRAAGEMGFSRVVLARELPLGEIHRIAEETSLELEAFVHGALCMCYSGQCQMSRYFGGRSGNRGTCAQPCRLPYRTMDRGGHPVSGAPAYPLSPKDLCLLENLGSLIEAGVCSLKIEGRMKSPEYVAVVVRIYRKYLDQYAREGKIRVSNEDREAIAQIFNRGGFTKGFFAGDPGKDFLTGDVPKHRGVRIGKVVGRPDRRPDRRGPEKKRRGGRAPGSEAEETLVDICLEKLLSVGDGIEIHGRELTGGVLSYYKEMGGGVVRVGDVRGAVRAGDPVYRTSQRAQLEEARRTFEGRSLSGKGPGDKAASSRRLPVRFQAEADAAGRLTLTAEAAGRTASVRRGPFPKAGPDAGEGAFEGRICASLEKTGGTPFETAGIAVSGVGDLRIRKSEVNACRREVLEKLEAMLAEGRPASDFDRAALDRELRGCEQSPLASHLASCAAAKRNLPVSHPAAGIRERVFYTWDDFVRFGGLSARQAPGEEPDRGTGSGESRFDFVLPVCEALPHISELKGVRWVPYISSVPKGRETAYLEVHFDEVCALARKTGIYAGSLGWALRLREAGCVVYAGSGLNVWNREALRPLAQIGILPGAGSRESLKPSCGALPLMIVQTRIAGDILEGPGGRCIRIVRRRESSQTLLVPEGTEPYYERISLRTEGA